MQKINIVLSDPSQIGVGVFLKEASRLKKDKQKSTELNCFNIVLRCRKNKGAFASAVHKELVDNKSFVDCTGERPDIIINTETKIIGIEHCRADLLFWVKKEKAQSLVGTESSKCKKLIDKYKDEEVFCEALQNGTAIEPVLAAIEDRCDRRKQFNYSDFVDNFRRVCRDHNSNSDQYRKRLNEIAPDKNSMLICLVEIPCLKHNLYSIKDSRGERQQALTGVPITRNMLSVIQCMQGFDYVILCMYCFDEPKNIKKSKCYYFLPQDVVSSAKLQHILPVDSFDFAYKFDVKFLDEKTSISENGDTTIVARGTLYR